MKLNNAVLSQSLPGYALPQYDRQAMARRSRQQPTWLHFGAGNLFRAFPAVLAQRLLNAGERTPASSAARPTTPTPSPSFCALTTT